jgi:hypothetical protein
MLFLYKVFPPKALLHCISAFFPHARNILPSLSYRLPKDWERGLTVGASLHIVVHVHSAQFCYVETVFCAQCSISARTKVSDAITVRYAQVSGKRIKEYLERRTLDACGHLKGKTTHRMPPYILGIILKKMGARGSLVVKALFYMPGGRGFQTR